MTLQDREAGLTSTNYSDFVFVGSNSGTAGSSKEVSGRDLRPGGAFLLITTSHRCARYTYHNVLPTPEDFNRTHA